MPCWISINLMYVKYAYIFYCNLNFLAFLQKDQKNFFQALSLCHTVQVAGDMNSNEPIKTKEAATSDQNNSNHLTVGGLAKMYSISDITEESHNSSQQSDVNCLDNSQIVETSLSSNPNGIATATNNINNNTNTTSDINPLLDESKVEKRKRPHIVKRSPNFARPTNRINPHVVSMPPAQNGVAGLEMIKSNPNERPVIFPSSLQNLPHGRPVSMQFKRSTSEMDLPEFATGPATSPIVNGQHGHRRSQSYGTPSSYLTQPGRLCMKLLLG